MRVASNFHAGIAVQLRMIFVAVLLAEFANASVLVNNRSNSDPEVIRLAQGNDSEQISKPFGRMHLLLSLKLSMPANEQAFPINATTIDGLQPQNLVGNETKLGELNVQIAKMEELIKDQQNQLDNAANLSASRMASPGAIERGQKMESVRPKPQTGAPTLQQESRDGYSWVELNNANWIKLATGVTLVFFAVSGLIWFQRYRTGRLSGHKSAYGYMDTHDYPVPQQPDLSKATSPFDEQINDASTTGEEKFLSILPPEYELLEEADIYLRFGHDKLAEEALKNAIEANPKNPQTYLRLLRIYFAREDKITYLAVVRRLKLLGDGMAWEKAMDMGRNMDPDNDFYT
jgi:hypothetical protein